jgi:hypothetical protein
MSKRYVTHNLRDNGGRRSGIERRRFSYEEHIPERRAQGDRRLSDDRRSGADRRSGEERRSGKERRADWPLGERRSVEDRHELKIS